MKISAKIEYACLAMLELATRYEGGEPVRIRAIAQQHGIPSRFLVQILLQLKAAGLVASTRGATGGYRLAGPPEETTLREVMAVMEGNESTPKSNTASESAPVLVLLETWSEVHDVQQEMLAAVTLADLADRARGREESMYYI